MTTATPSTWHGSCCPARKRTRPPGAAASGTSARLRVHASAPGRAPNHRREPRPRRYAPGDPQHRGIWKPWNSPRSTAGRPDQDRSRSRSAHPASTSPMSLSLSADSPASTGVNQQLGMDFAGVVTAIGPDVNEHQVGDRVAGFSENGCWATFVTCDAQLCRRRCRPGLTPDTAAAVSTAYATAWYGLHDLARIESGDRVLIHSATGGVGQAAIAIARAAGAEIFATAGSPQRRATAAGHGYRARLRLAEHRVRRPDPP